MQVTNSYRKNTSLLYILDYVVLFNITTCCFPIFTGNSIRMIIVFISTISKHIHFSLIFREKMMNKFSIIIDDSSNFWMKHMEYFSLPFVSIRVNNSIRSKNNWCIWKSIGSQIFLSSCSNYFWTNSNIDRYSISYRFSHFLSSWNRSDSFLKFIIHNSFLHPLFAFWGLPICRKERRMPIF